MDEAAKCYQHNAASNHIIIQRRNDSMADADYKPYGVIYCAQHRESGKRYIGQTTGTIRNRWNKHCVEKGCRLLHNAIQKYGKESFNVFQIDVASSKKELNEKEIFHIAAFQSNNRLYGYNIAPGGAIGKHAEETCEAIAAALRGRPLSPEHRAKLSLAHMGHKRSAESRAKQSASAMGIKRPKNAEWRANMSASKLGKPLGPKSAEHRAKLSAAHKGKVLGPMSEEQKKKRSLKMKGIPKHWSAEGRARTLAASRAYWEKYRLEKAAQI